MEEERQTVRKCVACGLKQDRRNFIRILQDHSTGEYIIRPGAKQFGKSVYVCKQTQCITKLAHHKRYKAKINFTLLEGELEQKQYGNCRQN